MLMLQFNTPPYNAMLCCASIAGVLVANKTDLTSQRVVSAEEGKQLASDNSLGYFECSVVSP